MTDLHPLLIDLLAQLDSLFWPFRAGGQDGPSDAHAATLERRKAYRDGYGLEFVGGGSAADRKGFERSLAELQSEGLITLRRQRGKRIGVSFTPMGDDLARWATCSNTAADSWDWLTVIAAMPTNQSFALETHLLDLDYPADPAECKAKELKSLSKKLGELSAILLPLLARGWLDSSSDLDGRVGYGLAAAGRIALSAGKLAPFDPHGYDSKLANRQGDELIRLWREAMDGRPTWKSSVPSHRVIPLTAGLWPARSAAR